MSEDLSEVQTCRIPVASLVPADSPRVLGEVPEHVRLLAESEQPFPPILVHRRTMQVIDGMHRLRATQLRGESTVEVTFSDCDPGEAFLVAVRSNIKHGLPLTKADREAAAVRIVGSHPQLSDRMIGSAVGLAPVTVAAIRQRSSPADEVETTSRIGRDGRVRPLNSAAARVNASRMLAAMPDASLRDIAQATGLSPGTVRDVRERVQRGDDPVPERQRFPRSRSRGKHRNDLVSVPTRDLNDLLRSLRHDPSLRYSEPGRALLKWLFAHSAGLKGGDKLAAAVPSHALYTLAELAKAYAGEWLGFAARLEQQIHEDGIA
ncbi:ParB/RepB/Spo0J family partition protein [Micromonospora sp. Llam0]|uniref:ParB/RepB/Spo0J family partition protein n=1 Tax=Micromonospora sp. Llam0 TaxID=2485143 RepID=UPI0018F46DDC|nr:ParB/RepB/Spo0J family partition protein [Micromonospora sp. Llam0]